MFSPITNNSSPVTNISDQFYSAKDDFLSMFVPYYDLNKELQTLQGRVSSNSSYILNENDKNLLKEAFVKCDNYFANELLVSLSKLPLELICETIFRAMENDESSELQNCLSSLLKSLDLENLKLLAGMNDEKINETIKLQSLLKEDALKSVLKSKVEAIWKEIRSEVFYFCHHLIEMFISITGITEVGNKRKSRFENSQVSSYEAKSRFEIYLTILGYPSVIFAFCFATLGSALLAGLVTALIVAATIVAIPLYLRYLRPCPASCPGLENLNEKIIQNENNPLFARKEILAQIQNAFLSGKGVILTADPGTGKTAIVETLAALIVSGDSEEFLKNAQVFSVNANRIKSSGMDGVDFSTIESTFKRHSKDLVLFIDEIEGLFKENLLGKESESLLTFHDKFRQIICATTTAQYNATIKDDEDAFNRRFKRIEIKPMTEREMEIALYDQLHHQAPELILDNQVIPYIIENSKAFNSKTSKIDASSSLLSSVIVRSTHLSFNQLEEKINKKALKIDLKKKRLLHQGMPSTLEEEMKRLQEKINVLNEKKAALLKNKNELAKIQKLEKICMSHKWSTYKLADKIEKGDTLKTKEWLEAQVCHTLFSEFISQKRKTLGLPGSLDKKVIDEIISQANMK